MQIEINYTNPSKPKGVVGGPIRIPKNGRFQFFSHDGPVEIEFIDHAPFDGGVGLRLRGDHDFVGKVPGQYRFKCFLKDGQREIELDPGTPGGGGGEIQIVP